MTLNNPDRPTQRFTIGLKNSMNIAFPSGQLTHHSADLKTLVREINESKFIVAHGVAIATSEILFVKLAATQTEVAGASTA